MAAADSDRPPCANLTPPGFTGHWRDWHRGHGCDRDDGKPRTPAAITEITQCVANQTTNYLTDAELSTLRARTTAGDRLLTRALAELTARRAAEKSIATTAHDHSARTTKHFEPLLGYCVCTHCARLPEHEARTREGA